MKFCLSYWSSAKRLIKEKVSKEEDILTKKMYTEKCLNLLKKNYNEIYFITDLEGDKQFGHLPWTKKFLDLENIPKEYGEVWSLGKLKAFSMLAEAGDPFLHVDYDFFIKDKLPDVITKQDIVVQSVEPNLKERKYGVDYFEKYCKKKYFASNLRLDLAFNCGIVGGNDLDFFKQYSNTSIDMVLDPENKPFWLRDFEYNEIDFMLWSKAVLAEQYYLAICLKYFSKHPALFFNVLAPDLVSLNRGWYKPEDLRFFRKTGCIHLSGHAKEFIDINSVI